MTHERSKNNGNDNLFLLIFSLPCYIFSNSMHKNFVCQLQKKIELFNLKIKKLVTFRIQSIREALENSKDQVCIHLIKY